MTFGVGLRCTDGLVALADTRIVRGEQHSSKAKLALLDHEGTQVVVMTSGLRSIRDKVVLRLEDDLASGPPCRRLHELADRFGAQLRRAHDEDAGSLDAAGLRFDLHAIVGGRLPADADHQLMLVYPEGNWIVATDDAPFFVIGRSAQGRPILDRLAGADLSLQAALGLAYLAFDAARASVTDVDFPIDVVTMTGAGTRLARFDAADLADAHRHWQSSLTAALRSMPMGWATALDPTTNGGRHADARR